MASIGTCTQILTTTTTLFTSSSSTKPATNLSLRPDFYNPRTPTPALSHVHVTTTPTTPARSRVSTNAKASPGSASESKWTHEGSVTESLPNGMFRVLLDNQDLILGYISGKIRKNFVRILPGDRVKVEVSRYDTSRGRIVYRLRNRDSSSNND